MEKTSIFDNEVYYERKMGYFTITRELGHNEFVISNIPLDKEKVVNSMINNDKENGLKVVKK